MSGVLALIPARGQSKGLPRKNIRPLGGKPLIVWTIEAALAASGIDAVVVSTEDEEIADIARAAGAQVPFLRPADIAGDHTPSIAAVMHAVELLPEYGRLLLLQPTSPLRTAQDIEGLFRMADETGAPSIVSVCPVEEHPAWMYRRSEHGVLQSFIDGPVAARRQDLPSLYVLNGAMYLAQREWLLSGGALLGPETLGYVMPAERSIDIDTISDWRLAEMALAAGAAERHG